MVIERLSFYIYFPSTNGIFQIGLSAHQFDILCEYRIVFKFHQATVHKLRSGKGEFSYYHDISLM